MAGEHLVFDNEVVRDPDALTTILNNLGAQGWRMVDTVLVTYKYRRSIFVAGDPTEYLVVDWFTGYTPDELEQMLDNLGADGWVLQHMDLMAQNKRRGIFMRGGTSGGGGGIEEAPLDGITYGRMNAAWNPALALSSDVLDGGNF